MRYFNKLILFFILCWSPCVLSQERFKMLSRDKRTLLWKEGASRLQVITGLGVPVDLKVETVIIGTVVKANYKLPINASNYLDPYVYYARRKRSLSRWEIYDVMAQMFQMRGCSGKACILKIICELANIPVDKKNGLFDEIIHVLFNPKSTREPVRHPSDNEYFAAQEFGKLSAGLCDSKFADCNLNVIDMITGM